MDEEKQAYEYVKKYEKAIMTKEFSDLDKFDDDLKRIFSESKTLIEKNNEFYRSRIYTLDDRWEKSKLKKVNNSFNGYDKEQSFCKMRNIKQNRMNVENERCLYMSSDKEITLREIDASAFDYINVSCIKNREELVIADLSNYVSVSNSIFNTLVSLNIQNEIAMNYEGNNKYRFSQYVAKICKKLGYDGIAFKSKYADLNDHLENKGINYAIFITSKCEAINSNVYRTCERQSYLFDEYSNKKVRHVKTNIHKKDLQY